MKLAFSLRLRDVDCDFRLMRRSVFEKVRLTRSSGVICVELMKKVQDHGFRIAEVPVHHFHRTYGKSQFFNFPRVFRTLVGSHAALVGARRPEAPPPAGQRALGRRGGVSDHRDFYRGRRVLVTGGLGFIGSNLCRTLADLGARVTAVDSLLPDYGGNLFNLDGYEDKVRINIADVRGHGMEFLVRGQEVLFNLAGQVSHIDSMSDPVTDLEINCTSQLRVLEAVRKGNPELKIVYAGTRQVYGKPLYLPVDEKHLLQPVDVNGINKISGEFYHLVYHQVYGIRTSLAAAHQHLRPPPAHPAQPPGLHRLVRPQGRARRGDPGLRRRAPEARLQPRGRRGGRLPPGGGDGGRERTGPEPRGRASGVAPRARASCSSTWRAGAPARSCPSLPSGSGSTSATSTPTSRRRRPSSAGRPRVPLREGLAQTVAYYRRHREHYL